MIGSEIVQMFRDDLVDDSLSASAELRLLQRAYDRVNVKRMWNYLLSTDTTQTVASGTSAYSLPSDFLYPVGVKLLDSDGNYSAPYSPIPYKDRRRAQNSGRRYFIDLKNSQMTFTLAPTGSIVGQTIEQDYAYQPAEITLLTAPVFNRTFHPLLAYEMARIFWYSEQDEKDRSWNREMQREYDALLNDMETWDGLIESGSAPEWNPDAWLPDNHGGGYGDGRSDVPSW